jgi:hypothetical protein
VDGYVAGPKGQLDRMAPHEERSRPTVKLPPVHGSTVFLVLDIYSIE